MGYENQRSNRVGQVFTSNEGYEFTIVEYNANYDLIVEFNDKYKARVHTKYQSCEKGSVKNPYHKSVCGVGCLGLMENGDKPTLGKPYKTWTAMIDRCYNENNKYYKNYGAKGVYVDESWLIYANFLRDVQDIPGYDVWIINNGYALDKDILSSEIPYYSKHTCQFISVSENVSEMRKRVTKN